MTVQTEQGQIATVLDFLRNRRCEVAVGRQNSAAPDLIFEPIHFEQLYVVVGAASKWARARRVRLADPADEAWVQSPVELETGSPTLKAFRAAGLSGPRVVVTSASLNVRYGESGRFITMIPDPALYYGSKRAAVKVLPIKLPHWHVLACAITLKDRTLSPTARLFIDCLHEVAKPIARRH
jgi:DNA-binding transcriptional LysR family regulator